MQECGRFNYAIEKLKDPLLNAFTAGSVLFSDGAVITQDNANFFWDDTNNRLGIGINSGMPAQAGLSVSGEIDVLHTASNNDDHAIEIDIDAAGFGDVKAIDIEYETGAISAGEDEAVLLIDINEFDAAGGDVFGVEVLATSGGADNIFGMKVGAVVGPILQESGTFANPTTGTNDTPSTDIAAMIDGSTGTNTTIFVADNDYILIGAAAPFTEMEFNIETPANNPGIKPTFGYSIAGSHQFTTFSPVDGTDGFRHSGVIAWDAADLTSHVANDDTGTYDIKITRTHAVAGSVSLFFAKTAATVVFSWDKDGNIDCNALTTGDVFADNALIRGDGGASGIQGSGVLLDDSDNMLFPTNAEMRFRSTNNWIRSGTANFLQFNAGTHIGFWIGGSDAEVNLTANSFRFLQGVNGVGLDWATTLELDVVIGDTPQVTFTDGTIEPVTNNDIDLGTSSNEFKAGFFVGEVRAGNFVADAADSFVLDGFGLVIGHTAQIDFGATPEFQVLGTEVPDSSMGFATFNVVASNAPDLRFLKSRGVTIGSNVLVQDGDRLGRIRFQGADGNDFNTTAAEFQVEVDGAASLNNVFGRFVWRTRTSGGLNEKMSLSAEGTLDIVNLCKASAYESDVATGTAPLVVASTTVVPNLNVDQVDGKDSTDLLLVDGSQALSADWDAGSFDIRAAGFIADGDPGGAGVGTIVWTGITVDKSVGGPTFPALPSGYTAGGDIWLKCYANGVEGAVPFWRKT